MSTVFKNIKLVVQEKIITFFSWLFIKTNGSFFEVTVSDVFKAMCASIILLGNTGRTLRLLLYITFLIVLKSFDVRPSESWEFCANSFKIIFFDV